MPTRYSFPDLSLLLLFAYVQAAAAKLAPTQPRPANPFLDPSHDPYNPLHYVANNTLTAVAFTLYLSVALFMAFATFRWGAKYMLAMVIGAYTFSVGLALRFGLHLKPESKGIYIAEYLFIVLSPCAFIAADYVLLSRIARLTQTGEYLMISPSKITRLFVSSDITTFLIQAIGGSISVSANDIKRNTLGSHVFLAGLVGQLLSFSIFTCVFLTWLCRIRKHESILWDGVASGPMKGWKIMAFAEVVSCIGILIRSVYRVAELSQGFRGHLATTESIFYGLDTYPLFLAVLIYVPFWPGRIIPGANGLGRTSDGIDNSNASVDTTAETGNLDDKVV